MTQSKLDQIAQDVGEIKVAVAVLDVKVSKLEALPSQMEKTKDEALHRKADCKLDFVSKREFKIVTLVVSSMGAAAILGLKLYDHLP